MRLKWLESGDNSPISDLIHTRLKELQNANSRRRKKGFNYNQNFAWKCDIHVFKDMRKTLWKSSRDLGQCKTHKWWMTPWPWVKKSGLSTLAKWLCIRKKSGLYQACAKFKKTLRCFKKRRSWKSSKWKIVAVSGNIIEGFWMDFSATFGGQLGQLSPALKDIPKLSDRWPWPESALAYPSKRKWEYDGYASKAQSSIDMFEEHENNIEKTTSIITLRSK